jgi:ankyrin repeat protein
MNQKEVLEKVFQFLDLDSLRTVALVSRSWARVALNDKLWEPFFRQQFGNNLRNYPGWRCAFIAAKKSLFSLKTTEERLFWSVHEGQATLFNNLLRCSFPHPLLGTTLEDGKNLLHVGASFNRLQIIKSLLDYVSYPGKEEVDRSQGLDIDAKTRDGRTSLHVAAIRGFREMVSLLLTYGADIEATADYGLRAIHFGCKSGNAQLVEDLITSGADIDAITEEYLTPLHIAVQMRHLEVIRTLVESGASLNPVTSQGSSPLLLATTEGKKDIVEFLLEKGAEVNLQNNHGWSPLHVAAAEGHVEITKILLANKADPNLVTPTNYKPIHLANEKQHHLVVQLLQNATESDYCCIS